VEEPRARDWRGCAGLEGGHAYLGVGATRAAGVCEDMRTLRRVVFVLGPMMMLVKMGLAMVGRAARRGGEACREACRDISCQPD